ncbi:nitroreductase family protein [Enterovirga aerilata]|uniref:nitroreductase family protein n=1 Tax=Enterovirga aerilata TaxID=2730920 RepID=UPI003211F5B6
MLDPAATEAIEAAIAGRRSIRAFRPDPVPRETVERILDVAARAPSGTNMQPWRVYVLTGDAKRDLSDALLREHAGASSDFTKAEYRYYPAEFFEPYLGRRRKVGFDLYGMLGIRRGETERMARQHARNLVFFDAPVGLIFTIDRRLEIGSWLDYGMFLENIAIAARAHGLETCAQAAFAPFHLTIRRHLPITENEVVVCGMSLGHEDRDAPENRLRTDRVPASEFATFLGWDGASGPERG